MHLHSRKAALALSSFITSLYFRSKCDGQTNVIRLLQDSNLTLFTLKKYPKCFIINHVIICILSQLYVTVLFACAHFSMIPWIPQVFWRNSCYEVWSFVPLQLGSPNRKKTGINAILKANESPNLLPLTTLPPALFRTRINVIMGDIRRSEFYTRKSDPSLDIAKA